MNNTEKAQFLSEFYKQVADGGCVQYNSTDEGWRIAQYHPKDTAILKALQGGE